MSEVIKEMSTNDILMEILKELQFHGQLLSTVITNADEKQHEHRNAKTNIEKQINEIASKLEGSPFASMLRETAKTLGGKHGN